MHGTWRIFAVAVALLISSAAYAQTKRGWIGVPVRDLTKAEADKLGWDPPRGALVLGAPLPESPGDKAGFQAGDVLFAIERTLIESSAEFMAAVEAKAPGSTLRLRALRNGRELQLAPTIGERPWATNSLVMLDTGGHMAVVRGLLFTPDGSRIVSAGDDKVIRIWDRKAGRTERMIFGQSEPGNEGKIFALAQSPDTRWLAVGGWMSTKSQNHHAVRLYEFATGRLIALLHGHHSIVLDLSFSKDSKKLVSCAGQGDSTAIVWDIEKRTSIQHLIGHAEAILACAFLPDGQRVVTGGDDQTLKLWSLKDGREITTLRGHGDKVTAVAVSPADGSIASGGDAGEIRIWDGRSGKPRGLLANQGGHVGALRFLKNGKMLLSTCAFTGCASMQRIWGVPKGNLLTSFTGNDDIVLAANPTPDGRLLATGGGQNHPIHIWDIESGKSAADAMAGNGAPVWSTAFSKDSKRLAWGSRWESGTFHAGGPLEMQFRLPGSNQPIGEAERIEGDVADFVRGTPAWGQYVLTHRKGGKYGYNAFLDLHRDGQLVASVERDSTMGHGHTCYSFAAEGTMIVSGGSNGTLQTFDLAGRKLKDFVGHESEMWTVAPSPDGRYLLSGSADQTARLWNLKTGELIVTLFHGSDREWVMWTPQGYYMASPGADKIVGWQINKGPENAADYVGADQLRVHLNRPDIVERAIILASAKDAVRDAAGTDLTLEDLLAKTLPKFQIVSPAGGTTLRGGRALIKIAAQPVPDAIKSMRVQVNGRLVSEVTPDMGSGGLKAGEHDLDVPLGQGRNEVRITLTNSVGDTTETLLLNHEGTAELDEKGSLLILAIGIDRYPQLGDTCGAGQTCDLNYPSADAHAWVNAIEERLRPGHTQVIKRVLTNFTAEGKEAPAEDTPTAVNIIAATDMLKQATKNDTVVLFIAGHGDNEGADYRLLATNAQRLSAGGYGNATVVPWQFLQGAVESTKGRRILFLDTCHSGNAYNQKLGNAAYHANIIAYTSARFDQAAIESSRLGHGLFTYAVVEALKGKDNPRRELSTKALHTYVVKRVDELAKSMRGEQEPQYFVGRDAKDYVLASW